MGILNVTPDSFSDGGRYNSTDAAVERGLEMVEEGADIIDIGGESTRPGSERVSEETELKRVLPVIEKLLYYKPDIVISVDTYKSQVAAETLKRGALIINDISALRYDEHMPSTIKDYNASVILMHMKGDPKTMQNEPYYDDVIGEITAFLKERGSFARENGITQVIIDPGIGFGKRLEDNLDILNSLSSFKKLGFPILLGASRKSFIGKISGGDKDERLEGSIVAAALGIINGASIVRAHDVAETKKAVSLADALRERTLASQSKTGNTAWN